MQTSPAPSASVYARGRFGGQSSLPGRSNSLKKIDLYCVCRRYVRGAGKYQLSHGGGFRGAAWKGGCRQDCPPHKKGQSRRCVMLDTEELRCRALIPGIITILPVPFSTV